MEMPPDDLMALMLEYGNLSKQYQDVIAPFKAQMQALQIQSEDASAHLTFQMETLEAVIKPLILEAKSTQKVPYLTAIYSKRHKWDTDRLFLMAEEVPAIMQAYEDASTVQFRKTGR